MNKTYTRIMNGKYYAALPPPIYMHSALITKEQLGLMYFTCKRGNKHWCIITNYGRVVGKALGRIIRYPATYDGQFHWSEVVTLINSEAYEEHVWVQLAVDLDPKWAKKADKFDSSGAHFAPPKRCPFGPTQFVRLCIERTDNDDVEGRERRRTQHAANVANGQAKERRRVKLRGPQYEPALRRAGL